MNLLVRWLINTLALFIVVTVVPHFHYRSIVTLAIAALVLGLANAIVRPVLFVLTLPLTILTLGLFLLVLNGIVLWLVSLVVPGFAFHSFFAAFLAALVLSVVGMLWKALTRDVERRSTA